MIITDISIIINPPPSHRNACKLITRYASAPNVNLWKRDRNALSRWRSSGESISFYYYDRELTRCNSERRQMTHLASVTYIHTHIRTYVHTSVNTCVHICICMYIRDVHVLVTRARRGESSRRCNDAGTACNRLSFLLHYSSPKWMMQIMFRTNSRIYTHAPKKLYAFILTYMDYSFFSRVGGRAVVPNSSNFNSVSIRNFFHAIFVTMKKILC